MEEFLRADSSRVLTSLAGGGQAPGHSRFVESQPLSLKSPQESDKVTAEPPSLQGGSSSSFYAPFCAPAVALPHLNQIPNQHPVAQGLTRTVCHV